MPALLLWLLPSAALADLDSYLRQPEPAYRWELRGEQQRDGCTIYDLHLVSQVWQGITWEHHLQIIRPENPAYPHFCALKNTGSSGRERDTVKGIRMARDSGAIQAILFDIPNEPLFGKKEDDLIVHTWLKYLETGDESWPLHFPMAKALLKAMDTIQDFTRRSGLPEVTGFLVSGGSKRGWTAWLVGASRDPRVKAIAPMVIDVLNLPAQQAHQRESYGSLSEQIDEYSRAGIPEKLQTPSGRRLVELEDPYSYRKRLMLPKLLILGTNDAYWTLDALNLYWDGLKGPKWVLYAPNSGHGLEDQGRVDATLAAFIRMNAAGGRWPTMRWKYARRPRGGGQRLTLVSDIPPKEARLFHAHALTRDFREASWSDEPMACSGRQGSAFEPIPAEGTAAIFGEAVYELEQGHPFTLSTQIHILEKARPNR